MTEPRHAALDFLAALTDDEFKALTQEARDPHRRTKDALAAINDQLRHAIARTDRNGRTIEESN